MVKIGRVFDFPLGGVDDDGGRRQLLDVSVLERQLIDLPL